MLTVKNTFDTRNRPANVVIEDLRAEKGLKLAVLGTTSLSASAAADAIIEHRTLIVKTIGGLPIRLVTSCRDVGAEKAARLAAKRFTGRLAAVIHRAEVTYGANVADMMANMIIERESDALLVLSTGSDVCSQVRTRFELNNKKVYEIEFA